MRKINKEAIAYNMFFCALAVYTFSTLITNSFYYIKVPVVTFNYITVFCILLLVCKETIYPDLSKKSLFLLVISCLLFVLASGASINNAVYLLFIFSGRNCNFKKSLKVVAVVSTIGLGFVVISSLIGIIENYTGYSNLRERQFLGFTYALYAPAIAFNITAIVVYLYKSKIRWIILILLLLFNVILYSYSQSNLSFYLAILLILFSALVKMFKTKLFSKQILYGLTFSYIFFFFLSILFGFNYSFKSKWMYTLDQMLENRLSLANESLLNYGVHLGGTKVEWTGFGLYLTGQKPFGQYIYVDNFYIYILQLFGIAFSLILIFLLTWTLFKCYKNNDFMLSFIFFIYAIHGLIDNLMFTPYYNAFFLAIGSYTLLKKSFMVKKVQKTR